MDEKTPVGYTLNDKLNYPLPYNYYKTMRGGTFMNELNIRRSIRRFTDKPVTEEQMEQLLRAAMQAPSAGNAQTWEFVVVKNKNTFVKIMNIHPYATPLQTADAAIVVCGNTNRERYDGFWVQDCSAAMQNLLLKAVELLRKLRGAVELNANAGQVTGWLCAGLWDETT